MRGAGEGAGRGQGHRGLQLIVEGQQVAEQHHLAPERSLQGCLILGLDLFLRRMPLSP